MAVPFSEVTMARILMVEPEPGLLAALRSSPLLEGHTVDVAAGSTDAVRRVRRRAFDVLITAPDTDPAEDEGLLDEVRSARPGVRIVLLTPRTTPAQVIAALRKLVFACFSAPFDASEIADMVARAAEADHWKDGIEVLSATPDWIHVRVNCRLLSAERLVNFLTELRSDVPDSSRDDFMFAFREVLMNAMEHGGRFDPDQVVEVTAVRTARTMVFHLVDPGPGFDLAQVAHAAVNRPDDPLAVAETRAESGLRPGGFGLLLAREIVDEMIHNERGNAVILIKHLR
jgi:anti-sigma regulatory factor (Ser/Thr protein kinase)/DNA-binding NarL/FixJ family response regulator